MQIAGASAFGRGMKATPEKVAHSPSGLSNQDSFSVGTSDLQGRLGESRNALEVASDLGKH